MIAYTYPILDVFLSMFVFFGLLLWVWVLITIFVDVFRSRDMGGIAKALWFLLVLVFPLFGSLIYLIVRGRSMHERAAKSAEEQEVAFRHYVQDAARPTGVSTADELSKLSALVQNGTITQQEFETEKAKLLGTQLKRPKQPTQPTAA